MTEKPGQEQREYFRSVGVVYLHVLTLKEHFSHDELTPGHRSRLDPVALKTMSLKSKISYYGPELKDYLLDILSIIEELHKQVPKEGYQNTISDSQRQTVIISGSGMQFVSDKQYPLEEDLFLTITFPSYPNETIRVQGEVIQSQEKSTEGFEYRTAVKFKNLSDSDLQLIIQFGNKLQREKQVDK